MDRIIDHRKKLHPVALAAMITLAAVLVIVGVFAVGRRGAVKPALELDRLQPANVAQDRSVRIGGETYTYFCSADRREKRLANGNVRVIAFHAQRGAFGAIRNLTYFAVIEAEPSGSWIVSYSEDGSGTAKETNLMGIYRREGTDGVPRWIEKMNTLSGTAGDGPASGSDLNRDASAAGAGNP